MQGGAARPGRPERAADDREGRLLRDAATLVGAPAEVVDFLVPLWATASLGASPAQVGAILAVEAGFSLIARPLAGRLSDRGDTRRLGALGAVAFAVSLVGYAVAPSWPVALAAAAIGGVGGAFFWVALRARVARDGMVDTFGQLLAAQSQGALVGFIGAFLLLDLAGYPAVFLAGATAAVVGGLALMSCAATPLPDPPLAADATPRPRRGAALTALLATVVATAAAETGVAVMLLLRLQREFGLEPVQIAWTLAPGFVAFIVLPPVAHVVVRRLGRVTTTVLALLAGAVAAVGIGVAGDVVTLGAAWLVTSALLAIAIPVEESTVAELHRSHPGTGAGRYEAAQLAGALIGSAVLPAWYGERGGLEAGAIASVVLLATAMAIPFVVARLGLPARPGPRVPRPATTDRPHDAAVAAARNSAARGVAEVGPTCEDPAAHGLAPVPDLDHARRERQGWLVHLGLFVVAQAVFAVLGQSWPVARILGDSPDSTSALWTVSRIWVWVLLIDLVWSLSYSVWPRQARTPASPGTGSGSPRPVSLPPDTTARTPPP